MSDNIQIMQPDKRDIQICQHEGAARVLIFSTNNLYILNAVRCPYRMYICSGWRGQLSREWRHNKNGVRAP